MALLGKNYWETSWAGVERVDEQETGDDLSEYNPQGDTSKYLLKITAQDPNGKNYKLNTPQHNQPGQPGSAWGPTATIHFFPKLVFEEREFQAKPNHVAIPQYLVNENEIELPTTPLYKLLRAEIVVLSEKEVDGIMKPDLMLDTFYWTRKLRKEDPYPEEPIYHTRYWWRG